MSDKIKVTLANGFMWCLPDGRFHMTEENPGPLEIDLDTLSMRDKDLVIAGITKKKISSSGQLMPQVKPVKVEPVASKATQGVPSASKYTDMVKTLLNKTVSTIKGEVIGSTNVAFLREVAKHESSEKNRSSVIKAVESRLLQLTNEVTSKISNNQYKEDTTKDPLADKLFESLTDTPEKKVKIDLRK